MNDSLRRATEGCRGAVIWLAVFSAAVNLLMLTAPLYMLQVFDRVLTSRSTDTLIMLSLMAGAALLTLAALEGVRGLALGRLSGWLDGRLGEAALQASILDAFSREGNASVQGLRDLATFRSFIGGPSVLPMMDAPWTPLFIAVSFLLHPLLGVMALGGAIVLLVLAIANELATRTLLQRAGSAHISAMQQAESAVRNADVIEAMGMRAALARRWKEHNGEVVALQDRAGARSSVITSASKFFRLALQVGTLGVGAFLVIGNELSPGGMIASTILLGRALAPVDQAIGSWKAFLAARTAYRRLREHLARVPVIDEGMSLPRPRGELVCENLTFVHGENREPTLKGIQFQLPAGRILGLVGPSAAGKTTLARLLVGNLEPHFGHVRLDGMDMSQWSSGDRGQHVGYLPQDIELFSGTVRENIARMSEGDPEAVIAAAHAAGVHDLILRLPKGYDTQVGDGGAALSGGQRQRVALARALYGNPALVVLDEPNSNLDHAGEMALLHAISQLKATGATVVLIAHQPNMVRQADYLLVLGNGTMQMSGPARDVIERVTGPRSGVGLQPAEAVNHG